MKDEALDIESDWNWLLSKEGKAAIDSVETLAEAREPSHLVKRLRTLHPPGRSGLILQQLRLRRRAAQKFSDPENWYWTSKLLEQSSDDRTARHVARYFSEDCEVVDLCCGAGSDAVALASRCAVLYANDIDPRVCRIAAANFRNHDLDIPVMALSADSLQIPNDVWIHIDPDRRPANRRTTQIDSFSPGLEFLEACIRTRPGGSIKLAPGTRVPAEWESLVGGHWISRHSSMRQLRVWWGHRTFEPGSRTVSFSRTGEAWTVYQRSKAQWQEAARNASIGDGVGEWIGDTDPAFRAAELLPCLSLEASSWLIGDANGYLSASQPACREFIRWFQVEDVLAADEKKLRKYFQERRVGILEIKQRHVQFDIDRLRASLRLRGEHAKTLFLTNVHSKIRAIVATEAKGFDTASTQVGS